jgi:hypothetical protein
MRLWPLPLALGVVLGLLVGSFCGNAGRSNGGLKPLVRASSPPSIVGEWEAIQDPTMQLRFLSDGTYAAVWRSRHGGECIATRNYAWLGDRRLCLDSEAPTEDNIYDAFLTQDFLTLNGSGRLVVAPAYRRRGTPKRAYRSQPLPDSGRGFHSTPALRQ